MIRPSNDLPSVAVVVDVAPHSSASHPIRTPLSDTGETLEQISMRSVQSCSQSGLCVGRRRNRPRALFQSESAKDQLHRVDRGWPVADAAVLGPDQSGSASRSAATLPSSSSMTRISTQPSMARSAMRARPARPPTAVLPSPSGVGTRTARNRTLWPNRGCHRATRRILPGSRKRSEALCCSSPQK